MSGTIYWNERQILRDRAALDGARPPAGPLVAFPRSEYSRFARLYGDSLMTEDAAPPLPRGVVA